MTNENKLVLIDEITKVVDFNSGGCKMTELIMQLPFEFIKEAETHLDFIDRVETAIHNSEHLGILDYVMIMSPKVTRAKQFVYRKID